jgi:hypothetical protein
MFATNRAGVESASHRAPHVMWSARSKSDIASACDVGTGVPTPLCAPAGADGRGKWARDADIVGPRESHPYATAVFTRVR